MSNSINSSEDSFISSIMNKYMPFWPLFVMLFILSLAGAWVYLNYYATPVYEITASLMIKDEKKGVSDSKLTESIDAFTSNKTVENEINVFQSRALMLKVVNDLKLYAPIYEEGKFRSIPAYTTSPIIVELKEPEKATSTPNIYFIFDKALNTVLIDNKEYPLEQWNNSPYGVIKFTENPHKSKDAEHPLYFSIVDPQSVAHGLVSRIRIQASSKFSSVVNMNLKDSVPQRGEDILNHLISAYKQLAVNERNRLAANTLEFVEERIKTVVDELKELENEVVQFRSTRGGVNLGEQGRLYLENVRDNDRKVSELTTQLAVLDKVERYVTSRNNSASFVPSTLGINDQALNQLLQKLYDSEIQYQKLKYTTAENNPILIAVTNEIENIRPRILENIRNQRINLQASRANLASTNSTYNSVLQSIPQKERELMELNRQQTVKNNAYNFLLQKREETVLSYAPSVEESKVIDMAGSSTTPISPKPMYIYLMAIIGSLVAGVAFITGKELLSSNLLFRSEITLYTNAPIVAELSFVKPGKDNKFSAPTEASVVEQFRQLRVSLGLYGRTFIKKKILVTSSIPGEGKSYVSSNLALSLASSGKKVALLDFDLRNPNTSVQFDLFKREGIIEYLSADIPIQNILVKSTFSNLTIVPAGNDIGDHTELLLNGKLECLFNHLENIFDYLIIDTPPIDLVSDAYLLSEYSDISLLVMRHAYTPKSLVQRLKTDNKIKSLNNTAIVFNAVKPRGFAKGKYGYGYGYGYEYKYKDKAYRKHGVAARA
ncbi:GumC family protein [Pontibacter virosus]|uniref:non-specific protein-tyrosine kinase n=1 Tax=Pontibacter virosus TaxID=1765052 RepID=A0A2U1AJV0_9BACT|nr:polysaccharide biosynthesis tyrosine autokinase [Pontibacter virosus]PVY36660.1 capsular exopolysaccharide synthesis family protein [Pontibacter virosus]